MAGTRSSANSTHSAEISIAFPFRRRRKSIARRTERFILRPARFFFEVSKSGADSNAYQPDAPSFRNKVPAGRRRIGDTRMGGDRRGGHTPRDRRDHHTPAERQYGCEQRRFKTYQRGQLQLLAGRRPCRRRSSCASRSVNYSPPARSGLRMHGQMLAYSVFANIVNRRRSNSDSRCNARS